MKITIGHLYPDLLNLYGDRGNIQCMINGAGRVQQDHAGDEDRQGDHRQTAVVAVGFDQQRRRRQHGGYHADEMGNGAAGIFDMEFCHGNLPPLYKTNYDISTYSFENYIASFYILYY